MEFELDDVVMRYHGTERALGPLSLTIAPGRVTVLLGPSGCGKSTLLRLLNGLLRPSEGVVRVAGCDLRDHDLYALRHRIGYVIQEGGLFPHLSAAANVTLMARRLSWEPGRIASRLEQLAALVDLDLGLLERYPRQLSGGQRQRVSLMRALMLEPDALLLDEPLGALDPMIRAELQRDLRDIITGLGKTVVLVTHDLAEAAYLGDTIVLMRQGTIVQQGEFVTLRDAPSEDFVAAFFAAQALALPKTTESA